MTDHPTPAVLETFFRSALPPGENRAIVSHLVQGCKQCRKALASTAAGLFEPASAEPQSDGSEYDFPIQRALAAATRRATEMERERQAGKRAKKLQLLLAEEQSPRDPRRETERCRSLLEASRGLRFRDPEAMTMLASLAVGLAERLDPVIEPPKEIADLQAEAWAELGNARRIANDLVAAEAYLDHALGHAEAGTGAPLLLARIMDLTASLSTDRRRFEEALALFDRAYRIYLDHGERHLAGRTLVSKGVSVGYANDLESAIRWLDAGLALLDHRREPALVLAAVHSIIDFMVKLGNFAEAQRLLQVSRRLYQEHADPLNLLKLRWVEGKIAAGLDELGAAEAAFLDVRAGFEKHGMPFYVAVAALDLGTVWLRQGRTVETRGLIEETLQAFRALGIHREAIAALLMLREAFATERGTVALLQAVSAQIQRMERDLGNGPI